MTVPTGRDEGLTLSDVVAGYGRGTVLHGLSLSVPAKNVVAIIGPNGAGKTTLMRSIMGLLRVRSGTVSLHGRPITNTPPDALAGQGLYMVPEGRRIFGSLTVAENLAIGAYTKGRRFNISEQSERVLAYFPELRKRLTNRGSALSGGEQQMLAIARALMADPHTLLIDEASLGLAPVLIRRLGLLLKQLKDELGLTLVLVEQGTSLASAVADEVHVMVNGTLVTSADGEYGSLVQQYTDYSSQS
jgi:branched-chain amino acid transport system ATP-binding protein